jgi:hypothetical protein
MAKSEEACCDVLELMDLGWHLLQDGGKCMPYIVEKKNPMVGLFSHINKQYRVNYCPSCGKEIRNIIVKPKQL